MSVTPSPIGGFAAQFFDNNGVILSGGKIYTYAAGTTTPQATYTSATGTTPHTNPIVLDSAGRVPGGEIWLTDSLIYKFVIETSTAILIGTYDNITGVNSNFVNYTVQEEVITATAGQTVFNLSTINYTPGTNSLSVYIDGVNQYVGDSYLETDSTTVTFTSGLHVGAEVKFTTAVQITTGAMDASAVGYTANFTGATGQTVQTKLEQYVSVKDFGAVGDGVADDTAAIQAAVNASTSVFIPVGTYMVSSTISIPNNTTVYGAGFNSILKKTTETVDAIFDNTDKGGTGGNIILRDFKIDGSRTTTGFTPSKDAIYLSYALQCIIENLLVINCKNDGIIIEYGANNVIKNCIVSNCTKQGIYLSGTEYCTVVGNNAYANLVGGIAVAASWACVISGNNCNQNTSGQFFIGRDSRYCEITGNFFGSYSGTPNSYSIFVAAENLPAQTLHGVVYPGGDTLYGITSCNFTGNTLLGSVRFVLANNNSFVGNRVLLSDAQGFCALGSQYNTIKDNRITDWAASFSGIQISDATSGDGIPASMSPPIASISNTVMDNDVYDSTGTKSTTSITGAGNVVFGNRLNGATTDNFYEFGAWTPVIYGDAVAGTNTYSTQTGYYVRIGKNVFVQGDVRLSAKDVTMAGNIRIGALPVTPANVGASAVCISEFVADLSPGYSIAGANIQSGQTFISLTQSGDNIALSNLDATNVLNSSRFTFSASYSVA